MLVELKNAKKHYKEFDLSCTMKVAPGNITGLIGRNGSGKTTTFKAILGLIKLDEGSVEIFGKDPQELTNADKMQIGAALSESGFSEYLTVKDIKVILSKMYDKFDKSAFEKICKRFQIPENKRLKNFSTGMKAKLKVIVAMSHEAELLILDEPTAGLDIVARQDILDMIQAYMEHENRAVLISSHISSDLEHLCDDFYMIDQGQIILHEETDILLSKYGVIKVTNEEFETLDKQYILKVKREAYGYRCLTSERQFYSENYPNITIEKANIDEMILIMIGGE